MADSNQDEKDRGVDLDGALELNFVPAWARKPPQTTRWADEHPRSRGRGRDRQRRDDYAQGRRDDRHPGRHDKRRRRAPRDERRERRPSRPDQQTPHYTSAPPQQGAHPRPAQAHNTDRRLHEPAPPHLPLDIRIIPDQQGLQAVARRIHHSWMAYPIMDLASIFLARPELTRIRIEVVKGEQGISLYQCKVCGAVTMDRDQTIGHIVSQHLEDYYEKEETLSDPPSGTFVCVTRCGMSGEILGPPNHHSYAQRLQEVHDSRYPDMDMTTYCSRIETLHDEAAIEAWKEQARKQTVYRRNRDGDADTEGVPEMDRAAAIREFRTELAPDLVRRSRRVSVPATVALHMETRDLRDRIRRLWEQEERFPLKISFALRAAFKHMHLRVFKAGKDIHFVTRVQPCALDPEHVVDEIREVLDYLHDHPGISREQLLEGLRPGLEVESDTAHEVLAPLSWLIERGHIIEFFNGTLSVPLNKRVAAPVAPRPHHNKRRGHRRG